MVVRKASIPYPTSLPPPPPSEPSTQESHHQIDSSTIPYPPQHTPRSNAVSGWEEMGNPWQSEGTPEPIKRNHNDVPDLLRPGLPQASTQSNTNLHELPDALRPGWSGEATPPSSPGSNRDRSPEREWWDDDDVVEVEKEEDKQERQEPRGLHVVNGSPLPSPQLPSTIKRKPLPSGQEHTPQKEIVPQQTGGTDFASNNPFRRPSETFLQPPTNENVADWGSGSESDGKGKARDDHPHPLRSSPSIDRMGQLNMRDAAEEKIAIPQAPESIPPPPPQQVPPPLPPQTHLQPPLIPTQPHEDNQANPWVAQQTTSPIPSPNPFDASKQYKTVSTDDLIDRGQHQPGSVSLGAELRALPNAASLPRPSTGEASLLDDEPAPFKPPRPVRRESNEMYAPPPGPPPSHMPPIKPPRPAVVTSEADLAKMREQRNETYQIKHFNWFDLRTSRMRRSSMLTQNKNGPCPLLALVNALILGATEDTQAALDEALRTREQVTLGLIVETLMDELITRASSIPDLQLPEIDELNRFLMRLRTGMNANPRFVPSRKDTPNLMDADTPTTPTPTQSETSTGTFESTSDIKLYGSFNVKLVHGWLPRPDDQAAKAFSRSAQTYEDAQAVQFGEEELEYKLSHGGLSEQEQGVWEDITSIKQFFQAYPTQLTPYGLGALQETLQPGEFAILFRNDHFSTIYKHPRDQRLYTLITDAGYADRDEIIWESLEDINGARSDFFSGDFQSVAHGDTRHPMPHSMTDAANPRRQSTQQSFSTASEDFAGTNARPAMSTHEQEQHDADFAMALQLQEEEEQRMRQARNSQGTRGRGDGGIRPSPPDRRTRRSQGNIPIPLRSNPGGELRPVIPPRNPNATHRSQAVSRPADAADPDAPPTYDEAARSQPYLPPVGSPLHPSSSTDLPLGPGGGAGRASTSTSNVHAHGQTSGRQAMAGRRRTSAYGENADGWGGQSPDYSVYGTGNSNAIGTEAFGRRRGQVGVEGARDRDRDCVVM